MPPNEMDKRPIPDTLFTPQIKDDDSESIIVGSFIMVAEPTESKALKMIRSLQAKLSNSESRITHLEHELQEKLGQLVDEKQLAIERLRQDNSLIRELQSKLQASEATVKSQEALFEDLQKANAHVAVTVLKVLEESTEQLGEIEQKYATELSERDVAIKKLQDIISRMDMKNSTVTAE